MSESFLLPSTISSKKSSSCPIIPSTPHCKTPKQFFKFSTLSSISIPISFSYPTSTPSIAIFSSSNANFAARNSKRATPASIPRFALEATKPEPLNELIKISSCCPFSRANKLVSGKK
ncbi:BRCT domain-containing DNA repair protein [Striga asiatica]|uniref:BRCT domain-containing DNA repair protein n=1 Tax=Striga asiatica TaxID=4170 RepID=A0A5A7RIE3_STRAF|nr:BRCT domain-containing DNA repair protein [Striga asiatica]